MAVKLPSIREIDCLKGDEVSAYGQLLISSFHENGRIVLDGTFRNRQVRLVHTAEEWLRMVEDNIEFIGVEHRIALIDRYNMLYRYIYRVAPNISFVNRVRYSVVEAVKTGNKKLDLAQAMWLISFALRTSKTFDSRGSAKRLFDSILKKWFDDFNRAGNFLDMSQTEALQRATTLIREDLSGISSNPRKFKYAVADRISLLFNNLINKDKDTLKAMTLYLRVAEGMCMDSEETDTIYLQVLDILSRMPGLNKFERIAYALEREVLAEQILYIQS